MKVCLKYLPLPQPLPTCPLPSPQLPGTQPSILQFLLTQAWGRPFSALNYKQALASLLDKRLRP